MNVKWNENVCTHSGECVKGLPSVFKVVDSKFVVDVSAASEKEVIDQVNKCPSGALTIEQ